MRQVVRERGYVAPVLLDESGDVTGKAYGVWGPPTAYFMTARDSGDTVDHLVPPGRIRRTADEAVQPTPSSVAPPAGDGGDAVEAVQRAAWVVAGRT